MRRILTAALVALFMLPSAAFADPPGDSNDPLPGLAETRLGLASGKRAEALARMPEFAAIRASWPEDAPVAFGDQLEYQIEFRENSGWMNASDAAIAEVMGKRPETGAMKELSLYMSPPEWAEFERRSELAQAGSAVRDAVIGSALPEPSNGQGRSSTGTNFAGLHLDHQDGGVLKLAVKDPNGVDVASVARSVPGGAVNLWVIDNPYSLDELWGFWETIVARVDASGLPVGGGPQPGIGPNDETLIEVIPFAEGLDLSDILKDIPSDAYVVAEVGSPGFNTSTPLSQHSSSQQQPGLKIRVRNYPSISTWSGCTWGFNGHTSYYYVVTAGHCSVGTGGGHADYGWSEVRQPDTSGFITSPRNTSTFGAAYLKYGGNEYQDAARFQSSYANHSYYHAGSDKARLMGYRASLYATAVGQYFCASLGESNTYRCGYGEKEEYRHYYGPNDYGYRFQVGFATTLGDSGAGLVRSDRIWGLATTYIGNSNTLFVHAYRVKTNIGNSSFDFNCGLSAGNCPVSSSG